MQHYPEAKSKEEALVIFIERSLMHSKESDEIHDAQIDELMHRVKKLERTIQKLSKEPKPTDFASEK